MCGGGEGCKSGEKESRGEDLEGTRGSAGSKAGGEEEAAGRNDCGAGRRARRRSEGSSGETG